MIVKRQSSSASPRQILAAIDGLSSTIIYLRAFVYRQLRLGASRDDRNTAAASRSLMSVTLTGLAGFGVHFLYLDKSNYGRCCVIF